MNILVTGGTGYIGSHFVNLYKNDYKIYVLDVYSPYTKVIRHPNVEYIFGDLTNKDLVLSLFRSFRPECVFHFAAEANVSDGLKDPYKYYKTNVFGTLNLLEAMRETGCKKIVFSSAGAVYGPMEGYTKEDHSHNPTTCYGYSKSVCEHILKDYFELGISSISLRYFNPEGSSSDGTIGHFHQNEIHVIPSILQSILKQKEFYVFGNDYNTHDGTGVRDYIYVEDVARANMKAFEKMDEPICDVYNIGYGIGYSVLDLIKIAEEVTGKKVNYKIIEKKAGHPGLGLANIKKAKDLNWSPTKDIRYMVKTNWEYLKKIYEVYN